MREAESETKNAYSNLIPQKIPASLSKSGGFPEAIDPKKEKVSGLKVFEHERNTRASAGKDVLYFRARLKPDYFGTSPKRATFPLHFNKL